MLIEKLTISNLLSFGPEPMTIDLGPLNVLIGPNGSGKSNFLDVIELIRALPGDISAVFRDGGGVREWGWKFGDESYHEVRLSTVFTIRDESIPFSRELIQDFEIVVSDDHFMISEETIRATDIEEFPTAFFCMKQQTAYVLEEGIAVPFVDKSSRNDKSILAKIKDYRRYVEISELGDTLPKIALYRDWRFGRQTIPRTPQRADMPNGTLLPDASNLGLVLNRLRQTIDAKNKFLTSLRQLYDGIDDFDVRINGGYVQPFLHEGERLIPASRLSDGTLRYLCLLAILCDPDPPPLICIEEPELGMHPDVLPTIAGLLKDASTRTQLIVTTHSDILVDALTDTPEAVIVCEKHDGATKMQRLTDQNIGHWLEKYRLGELWTRGQIGGNRW